MIFQEREKDKSAVYTQINHLYILEVFFCTETIKYLSLRKPQVKLKSSQTGQVLDPTAQSDLWIHFLELFKLRGSLGRSREPGKKNMLASLHDKC